MLNANSQERQRLQTPTGKDLREEVVCCTHSHGAPGYTGPPPANSAVFPLQPLREANCPLVEAPRYTL